MELTFVVAVTNIWQLQPSWLHPCRVCDQGRSVGKIKFTWNSKTVGVGGLPPNPRNFFFKKKMEMLRIFLKSRALNGAFWRYLKRCFGSWNCWGKMKSRTLIVAFKRYFKRCFGRWKCWETFEIKDAKRCINALFEMMFGSLNCWDKLKTNRLPNGAFWLDLKRCKMRRRFIIIDFSGPMSFSRDFFVSYTI